ncbi:MAG: Ig-like domain-containing protein, partial [Geopsychrobacter sp.]|nr:Ig-like domain-containing protein [Geopsychrobacter sp.]
SWVSSTPTIATISNTTGSQGLISTLSDGSSTISASLDGVPADTLLKVTGGNLSTIKILPAENTYIHITPVIPLQLSAEGSFTNNTSRDISSEVTWSSSDLNVATIDPQGVVMTVGAGSTEIQATNGTVTGTKSLTVTAATFTPGTLTIAPATADSPTIASDTSLQFTASGEFSDISTRDLTSAVSWSSSDDTIAKVSDAAPDKGVANGVTAGTSTITADFNGKTASSDLVVKALTLQSIAIDNQPPSILPGKRLQLTVTATYTDASTQDITADVDWSSADTFVAIFHDPLKVNGEILGVDSGSVEITATFGGKTDLLTVTVP